MTVHGISKVETGKGEGAGGGKFQTFRLYWLVDKFFQKEY